MSAVSTDLTGDTGNGKKLSRLERRADGVYLVENGEITEPLREGNLIGYGPKVLEDIDMLGNDFAMGMPGTCGKDGQGVPVGDGQPTLRVKALTIGGTAA